MVCAERAFHIDRQNDDIRQNMRIAKMNTNLAVSATASVETGDFDSRDTVCGARSKLAPLRKDNVQSKIAT